MMSGKDTGAILDSAMVLAAGLGTRMRHLRAQRPKPLVELAGRPLIDHVLDRLADAGVRRAVVNVHHKADMIEAALRSRTRPEIIISDERDELLETGGGVVKALDHFQGRPFLIQNSDCVWTEGMGQNLKRLFNAWNGGTMDALLLLTVASNGIGYDGRGDFVMDPLGRLTRRAERCDAPFVFTGASIAHPRLFDDAPAGPFSLNMLWDRAIERGRLFGVRMEGCWMHVGTPEALRDAEAWMKNGPIWEIGH